MPVLPAGGYWGNSFDKYHGTLGGAESHVSKTALIRFALVFVLFLVVTLFPTLVCGMIDRSLSTCMDPYTFFLSIVLLLLLFDVWFTWFLGPKWVKFLVFVFVVSIVFLVFYPSIAISVAFLFPVIGSLVGVCCSYSSSSDQLIEDLSLSLTHISYVLFC